MERSTPRQRIVRLYSIQLRILPLKHLLLHQNLILDQRIPDRNLAWKLESIFFVSASLGL